MSAVCGASAIPVVCPQGEECRVWDEICRAAQTKRRCRVWPYAPRSYQYASVYQYAPRSYARINTRLCIKICAATVINTHLCIKINMHRGRINTSVYYQTHRGRINFNTRLCINTICTAVISICVYLWSWFLLDQCSHECSVRGVCHPRGLPARGGMQGVG